MHNPTIAILAAAVAAWLFGAVWYNVLGGPYRAALGFAPGEVKDRTVPWFPMLVCFLVELALAWVLFTLMSPLGARTWFDGLMTGLLLGAVFTALPGTVNNLFQGHKPMLSLINGVHWMAVSAIEGAILVALLR